MEMGQSLGIEVHTREYPGMGSSMKIDSGTFGAVDLKNNDMKSPFKWVDQVK